MLTVLGHSWWTIGTLALACVSSPIQSTSASSTPSTPITPSAPTTADPGLSCVDYRAEARYSGVGYDHLVHVSNQCDRSVQCDVSTNVNAEKIQVVVASKASQTVLTWRGSPAREFTAAVSCRLSD